MQSKKNIVIKCCICARERGADNEWNYCFAVPEKPVAYSHGICGICYQAEMRKIRSRMAVPVAS